jgi:hypothetical protein
MAKTDRDLFDTLRARGLRKSAASNLARAFGKADNSPPGKGAKRAVSELKDLVSELEGRVSGSGKRSAAAKKAAATRKRKANDRSRAAKKAAETRAKKSRSGSRTRAKAKS